MGLHANSHHDGKYVLGVTDVQLSAKMYDPSIDVGNLLCMFRREINTIYICKDGCGKLFTSNRPVGGTITGSQHLLKCQKCVVNDFLLVYKRYPLVTFGICIGQIKSHEDRVELNCCESDTGYNHLECIKKCNGICPYCRVNISKDVQCLT